MSIFSFCCVSRDAKQTPGYTTEILGIQDSKGNVPIKRPLVAGGRSNTVKILHRFKLIEDEIMMGFANVDLAQMCESLISESIEEINNKRHIVRKIRVKSVIQIFKETPNLQMTPILSKSLKLDYFLVQGNKDYYDFEKLVTFCMIYTKSPQQLKNELLFELMVETQSQRIDYGSQQIPRILEILVTITCFLIAHFLKSNIDVLSTDSEQYEFEELFNIFTQSESNGTLSDFILQVRNLTLFPLKNRGAGKQNAVTRDNFSQQQKQQGFPLVKSDCVREMFVKFVYANNLVGSQLGQSSKTQLKNKKHPITKNFMDETLVADQSISSSAMKYSTLLNVRESKSSIQANETQQQAIRFNKKKAKKTSRKEVSLDTKKDQEFFDMHAAQKQKVLQQSQSCFLEPVLDKNEDEFLSKNQSKQKQKGMPSEQSAKPVQVATQRNVQMQEGIPTIIPSKNQKVEKVAKQAESIQENKPISKADKTKQQLLYQEPVVRLSNFSQLGSDYDLQSSKSIKNKSNHSPDQQSKAHQLKARQSSVGTRATIQKKVVDVETHLCEIYGQQFYQMVYQLLLENSADFEEDNQIEDADHRSNRQLLKVRTDRFKQNKKIVNSRKGFKLVFPDQKNFNHPDVVKEILDLFKRSVTAEDIVALQNGTLFSESFLDFYFRILQKMNAVLLTAQTFSEKTFTPSDDTPCEKVLYLSNKFVKKLRKTPQLSQIKQNNELCQEVAKLFDYDVVLVPFFFESHSEKVTDRSSFFFEGEGAVIVAIQTKEMKIDLFDKGTRESILSDAGESKNQAISEEILNLLENAAKLTTKKGVLFNEDQVDGGVETVSVECEEDYLIAMMYIAECFTFNRTVDLETFDPSRERNKIVDVLLTLLKFQ